MEHLTQEELRNLPVSPKKLILLEHISSCSVCSLRLSEILSKQELIPAPHYMKQALLLKKERLKQKKQEFSRYCIKVSVAVAASLAAVFLSDASLGFISRPAALETASLEKTLSRKLYYGSNSIHETILRFTDTLLGQETPQ